MTAQTVAPIACEAARRLKKAAFELQQMSGPKIYDLGRLAQLLTFDDDCEDHQPGPMVVQTSSSPISLDPASSPYRSPYSPPFIGRAA